MSAALVDLQHDLRDLADRASRATEADLAVPWVWGSYSSEGVRFAFFRVLEELDALRAALAARSDRISHGRRILAGYNQAYRDLEAVVWGLDDETAALDPGGDEWSVRRTYAHILGADFGFLVVARFALDLHRSGNWSPDRKLADADYDRILDTNEGRYNELMESGLSILRMEHHLFHAQVITDLADVSDDELNLPSKYWEEEPYPLRFRLGRFASHMRQHTIQIEKTLPLIGSPPTEGRLLVRQLFNRFAEVENAGGDPDREAVQPAQMAVRTLIDALKA